MQFGAIEVDTFIRKKMKNLMDLAVI